MEKERTKRGRRTQAAHPAEMRLGSNWILYVGKQEAADAARVLRTLLGHTTHIYARSYMRSRAFMTPPWPTNSGLLIVGLSLARNCDCEPKEWNNSAKMLFFMQKHSKYLGVYEFYIYIIIALCKYRLEYLMFLYIYLSIKSFFFFSP